MTNYNLIENLFKEEIPLREKLKNSQKLINNKSDKEILTFLQSKKSFTTTGSLFCCYILIKLNHEEFKEKFEENFNNKDLKINLLAKVLYKEVNGDNNYIELLNEFSGTIYYLDLRELLTSGIKLDEETTKSFNNSEEKLLKNLDKKEILAKVRAKEKEIKTALEDIIPPATNSITLAYINIIGKTIDEIINTNNVIKHFKIGAKSLGKRNFLEEEIQKTIKIKVKNNKNIKLHTNEIEKYMQKEWKKLGYDFEKIIISNLELLNFKIDDNFIKELNGKISKEKLETLKKLQNQEFTKEDLKEKLKKAKFTDEEIKMIIDTLKIYNTKLKLNFKTELCIFSTLGIIALIMNIASIPLTGLWRKQLLVLIVSICRSLIIPILQAIGLRVTIGFLGQMVPYINLIVLGTLINDIITFDKKIQKAKKEAIEKIDKKKILELKSKIQTNIKSTCLLKNSNIAEKILDALLGKQVKITDETLKKLKGKLEPVKLANIIDFLNIEFSKAKLIKELEQLEFNKKEIELLLKNVYRGSRIILTFFHVKHSFPVIMPLLASKKIISFV